MAVSEIYQFIWEHGEELAEAPGWTYASEQQILTAFPSLTVKRLMERGYKSPYMSRRMSQCGSYIIGWFIHVPPRNNAPTKHRKRVRAPLPTGNLRALEGEKQQRLLLQKQKKRVQQLGWMSCIPTLDTDS